MKFQVTTSTWKKTLKLESMFCVCLQQALGIVIGIGPFEWLGTVQWWLPPAVLASFPSPPQQTTSYHWGLCSCTFLSLDSFPLFQPPNSSWHSVLALIHPIPTTLAHLCFFLNIGRPLLWSLWIWCSSAWNILHFWHVCSEITLSWWGLPWLLT